MGRGGGDLPLSPSFHQRRTATNKVLACCRGQQLTRPWLAWQFWLRFRSATQQQIELAVICTLVKAQPKPLGNLGKGAHSETRLQVIVIVICAVYTISFYLGQREGLQSLQFTCLKKILGLTCDDQPDILKHTADHIFFFFTLWSRPETTRSS